jgi:Ca2+-binding RTX toxin-like protein
MSARVRNTYISARMGIGCAVALLGAVLACTPALAATNVGVSGTLLSISSGKGQGKEKGKSKGKSKGAKEANRITIAYAPVGDTFFVNDVVDVTTTDPVCIDLGNAVACPGTGITAVSASSGAGDDFIVADRGPQVAVTLDGGDGNDTLVGSDGVRNEVLVGGKGNDRMLGGTGPDVFIGDKGFDAVSYGDHAAGVVVTIGSPFNDGNASDASPTGARDSVAGSVERIKGSPFDDVLKGDRGDNVLIGAAGNDRLKGKKGRDRLKGKAGIDILLARDGTRDRGINCGKGNNRRERAKFDKGLDPRPKSC